MSQIDVKFLNRCFHQYSDDDDVRYKSGEVIAANEIYIVTTKANKSYAIRLLNTQSPENAKLEATLQAQLKRTGVGTPQYLYLRNGEVVGSYGGRNFTISEFIIGKRPATISRQLVTSFGETLARIHTSLHGMRISSSDLQWLQLEYAEQNVHAYSGPFKATFANLFQQGQKLFEANLPKAVIHADLMMRNVFAAEEKVTVVFDFETVDYNYRVLDLARTFLSLQSEAPDSLSDILNDLIQGYNTQASSALTQAETDNLDLAIQFAVAACGSWCAIHGSEQFAEKLANLV